MEQRGCLSRIEARGGPSFKLGVRQFKTALLDRDVASGYYQLLLKRTKQYVIRGDFCYETDQYVVIGGDRREDIFFNDARFRIDAGEMNPRLRRRL